MTNQEAFDKMYIHLTTQKKKSLTRLEHGQMTCAYRGNKGLMCAVGCLLTDDEVFAVGNDLPVALFPRDSGSLAGLDFVMLAAAQSVHDEKRPNQWPGAMRALAKRFGLVVPKKEGK